MLNNKALQSLKSCDVIIGYKTYLNLLGELIKNKQVISFGMMQEIKRAKESIKIALEGKSVCIISSGDAGIYGMTQVVLEVLKKNQFKKITLEIIPGITAATSCASLLGAPLANDFAVISLSDLLTEKEVIKKRVRAAAKGDFVIVFYNPKSKKRIQPFKDAMHILRKYRNGETPVGIVKNAYRQNQKVNIIKLKDFKNLDEVDMTTTIIVGNSQTYIKENYLITPRGYKIKI